MSLDAWLCVLQADGNCMYRALAHQCQAHHPPVTLRSCKHAPSFLELRKEASKYISDHAAMYLPFISGSDLSQSANEQVESFCAGIENGEWGSHLELQALSEVLASRIQVCCSQTLKASLSLIHI